MKKQRKMTTRERRLWGAWIGYYNRLMAKPQRGFIAYGGGLSILAWINEAEAQGFHATMTPVGVELR